MQVRLIAKTTGELGTEYEGKSLDEIIVGIARLSSSRETNELFDEPHKLIRHCLLNQHWSVFSTVNMVFEIHTSRAMGRELLRHWSIRPQELSQRYAEITEFEEVELRKQSKNNRQSSTEVFDPITDDDDDYPLTGSSLTKYAINTSHSVYNTLLDTGVSRETARMILPECTQTRLVMNGTVREWITTLNQRLHKTAQKEIRMIAEAIAESLKVNCPVISKALYNFEYADEIHIIERLTLEKYKVFDIVKNNLKLQ
jgi:thymidylate synthase (FAD)